MESAEAKVDPGDYVLAVLSPRDRLEAAFKVAGEALRNSSLTMKDVDSAVKRIRRKAYEKKG